MSPKSFLHETDYCMILKRVTNTVGNFILAIELIYVKKAKRNEIRFCYYKKNKNGNLQLQPRPLDITPNELTPLFNKALKEGILEGVELKF
ncbi:hypothetical protein P8859_15115 [Bacillus spizizenii]|nr:hypothetical protein [Bacillus spizizenii]MCY8313185.1 hypothetical protein [Bacillus spizizenii]MCY8417327.1 hypothetical protein [Bacillus spizizenii]MCY9333475.1 hypothetical protein [Bacillus spizizenii]MEC0620620.1 hypothetical protein [Bacillus spizizenii]